MTDEAVINIASPPLDSSLLDASQDKSMNEPWMDLFSASARSLAIRTSVISTPTLGSYVAGEPNRQQLTGRVRKQIVLRTRDNC